MKIIHCLAFCCLLCLAAAAQTPVNGGFETGTLPPWTIWKPTGGGTPTVVNTTVHSGTYAVKISGGRGSIEQIVTGLKPWTQYTLSAWIKVSTATDSVTLGAKLYRGSEEVTIRAKNTSYTKYSLNFTTGGNNSKVTIYLLASDSNVVAYADDFEIVNSSPTTRSSYFIDNVAGNDASDGKTPATAWKNLTKVTGKIFFPGDSILFKKGGVWTGTLRVQGEGIAGKPIVVSSYGTGTTMPVFNGNGALRTVYFSNQQYIEVTGLEVTNTVTPGGKKRGIEVENIDRGKLTHIRIYNNNVHDVMGDNVKGQDGSIGIMAVVRKGSSGVTPSWFDSVWIESNVVKKVNRTAIGTSSDWRCKTEWGCTTGTGYYPSTNVIIRNNYVEDAGGDGIVPIACDATLVEYNLVNGANRNSGTANAGIWCFAANKNLFQFNEAYRVRTAMDGQGYDVDFGQDSTVFQYNYSHDNEGGFMLLCTNVVGANTNAVVRYNVSQNDKYRIIMLNGNVQNAQIYNNTMYLPAGSTTKPIVVDNWGGSYPQNIYVRNNIFHLAAAGIWENWDSITGTKVFDYNIVYGTHTTGEPTGSHNITSNPLLVAPGTGTTGTYASGVISFGNVDGYQLQSGSPAFGAGILISGNGGRDYWGNPVPSGTAPTIGAYQEPGSALKAASTQNTFSIYPSPATRGSSVTATIKAAAACTSVLSFVNQEGKVLTQQRISLLQGNNRVPVKVPEVAAGMYWIKMNLPGNQAVTKLLIR